MKLKKYRLFKFVALLMAFVWLFGAYATGMTGVHATDDRDDTNECNSIIGGDNLETFDIGAFHERSDNWVVSRLERRDHIVARPYERNDNEFGPPGDRVRRPYFDLDPEIIIEPGMTFDVIFNLFLNNLGRLDPYSSSTQADRHPAPEDRAEAFRVFNFRAASETTTHLYYISMCRFDTASTLESVGRWNIGTFQYAYVQQLHFDLNFDRTGGNIEPAYGREVIMGSHYDRMFVGGARGYETLWNHLFPVSPRCPITPRCPILAGIYFPANAQGERGIPYPVHRNVVHPNGYIFGGWFNTLPEANALGSQEGRVWEREMGRVTTDPHRTIFARWYPLPTINKGVTPGQLTKEQVADGATLAYTITVNTGNLPGNMIDLIVEDLLDPRLSLVESSVAISPTVGTDPSFTLADDGTLRFYIGELAGSNPIPNGRIVITFQAAVDRNAIPAGTTTIVEIPNIATLLRPPVPGQNGEEEVLDESPRIVVRITPPIPPEIIPPKCECPECQCPECECPECQCPKCQCEPCQRRLKDPTRPSTTGREAPRTGDLTSVVPLLSSILFSMSAIFGGTALRRRFKK